MYNVVLYGAMDIRNEIDDFYSSCTCTCTRTCRANNQIIKLPPYCMYTYVYVRESYVYVYSCTRALHEYTYEVIPIIGRVLEIEYFRTFVLSKVLSYFRKYFRTTYFRTVHVHVSVQLRYTYVVTYCNTVPVVVLHPFLKGEN